jgi:CHAD domain-containing protein
MTSAAATTPADQARPLTAARLGLPPQPRTAGPADGIAAHVQATVDTQLRVLLDRQDAAGRSDDPEAVHDMRVAIRRMRVALRIGGGDTDLRAELSWLGGALGAVRDLDVLSGRLGEVAVGLPEPDHTAFAEVNAALHALREAAVAELAEDLSGHRYQRLLAALAVRAQTGGLTVAGHAPSAGRLVRKPLRTFDRQVRALDDDPTIEQLHRLRIAGKRVRYAAELARSLSAEQAGALPKLVRAARDLQDVLGNHHDTVAAEQYLRELVDNPPTDLSPHAHLVIGRLIEREITLRAGYERAWPDTARKLGQTASELT